MPLFTTLAALSQTASSNPPDGAVDAPSSIDDQLRLLGSFVAQLRDGSGFTVTSLLPSGSLIDYAGAAAPSGFLLCDGSAVSRTTYSALFAAIGTIWGVGDGATTFNLPDFRGRGTIGSGTGAGLTARTLGGSLGEENHALTTAELATHNHAVGDAGHQHGVSITSGTESVNHTHSGTSDLAGGHRHQPLMSTSSGGLKAPLDPAANGIAAAAGTSSSYTDAPGGVASSFISDVGNHQHTFTTGGTSISHSHLVSGNTALVVTGITIGNNGSGTAHNNMQPSAVVTKIIKI